MIPYYNLVEEFQDILGGTHLVQLLIELLWKPVYKLVMKDMILFIKVMILFAKLPSGVLN
jgi:hypothetical protein